jgi:hypothetical protein
MDKKLIALHNLAEKIADEVIRDENSLPSITISDGKEEEHWTIGQSDEYENVVVFACDGNSIEYDYQDEKDLADIICDFCVDFLDEGLDIY